MTSFRDQSWDNRFAAMGDEAEGRFEKFAEEELGLNFVRFGLDRPPLKMSMLPTRLRYTPDYLMSDRFVEVQGFGRDQTFKIKLEKLNSLYWWNDLHPVSIYVWDTTNERQTIIPLSHLTNLINNGNAVIASFPEGKAYFAIAGDDIFA